ncbi:SRPBCC family protein [Propionicimonas sp.]|uniref:SRPBCC family protein n=1 Tax=Propionicimonas sp. TaxID=1955623 RepID=UPI0039E50A3A
MPVTDITKDIEARSLVITAEFAAPATRVWQVYADPRQLERVWGPPSHPATVVEHSLTPGGVVHYFMTGPDGEKYYGGWRVLQVEEPRRFTFEDFFADKSFAPVADLPVSSSEFRFVPVDGGTRAVFTTTYETAEALRQVLDMGMEEGATQATNQIDALLAEG